MVDDEAPKTRGLKHLKVRAKRWALVAERDMKVTADNMHLLKSMVRIQSGGKGEYPVRACRRCCTSYGSLWACREGRSWPRTTDSCPSPPPP